MPVLLGSVAEHAASASPDAKAARDTTNMSDMEQRRSRVLRRMAAALLFGITASSVAFAHAGGGGGGGSSGGHAAASGGAAGAGAVGAHASAPAAGSTGTASAVGAGTAASGTSAPGSTGHDFNAACAVGYVAVNGACHRVHAGILPDDQLYTVGRALALAGHYPQALRVLEAIQRTDDPMVYTMRGYALRKMGDFHGAMVLYNHALAIDPGNVNTHEYIGEGYVQNGRIELAKLELVKVRQGCGGTECEQYEDLAQAIATGQVE